LRRLLIWLLALAFAAGLAGPGALAAPPAGGEEDRGPAARGEAARPDDRPSPLSEKRRALKREAVARVIKGQARVQRRGGEKVVRLAPGQYVQLEQQDSDEIFTILAEFGDRVGPYAGEVDAPPSGPLHNQIPRPDRDWDGGSTDDNTTYWVPDFDRKHYMDMFFDGLPEQGGESLRDYYEEQSGGRYTVSGDVSEWVRVPYREARYGYAESNADMTAFIDDAADAWYEARRAAGESDAEIREYLSRFDRWDRYDHDGDGDFDEPDGYIDHFQAIHAGEGEEAGAPAWAIWSHRWYVNYAGIGSEGPEGNPLGGIEIGDTGFWIGDYTTEPENGGLGVFAHEYAHDLGLPDEYDTAGGENGTGFWTLMSAGSWLGHGEDAIGTAPGHMNAWDKLFLGWLDYEVVRHGQDERVRLGVAERTGKHLPQALIVSLPDQEITTEYNTPHSGSHEWWGGSEDNLNTTLARTLDLSGASSARLEAWAWYVIEEDYDYLYAEVSADGGQSWARLPEASGIDQDDDVGLDGDSQGWRGISYDLSDYAGRRVLFRFRYQTDGGIHYAGPFLDDLSLVADGRTLWTDDVESGEGEWTSDGWRRMTGSVTETAPHYYVAENRQYVGYDDALRTGPYNFGWDCTRPDWVQHLPYQDGLLVWYANHAYEDNNTSQHPGAGLILPVDARPEPIRYDDGSLAGNRIQPFDATFGLEPTDPIRLHDEVCGEGGGLLRELGASVPRRGAIRTFDDSDPGRYWSGENPQNSVRVAGSGTSITVKSRARGGAVMALDVSFE